MYVLIANCPCEYWTANNTNILIIENWPILCDIFIFKTLLRLIIFWISQIKLPFPFRVRSNKRVVKTDRVTAKSIRKQQQTIETEQYTDESNKFRHLFAFPFHRTSDTRKIFVFAILAKLEPRIGSSTSSVFFFSLSLSFSVPWPSASTEFQPSFEASSRSSSKNRGWEKKRRSRREGREKPVFKWASVIVSRGRGIKQDLLWRMCTGVWLYTRQKMVPLHSYPSIWGKKCFAQKRNVFDSFRLVIFYYAWLLLEEKNSITR